MRKKQNEMDALEIALRSAVPPLGAADPARVAAACAHLHREETPAQTARHHRPHPFSKPLARAAACLVLALGVGMFLRTPPPAAPHVGLPDISPEVISAFASAVDSPSLESALADEASDLADDLTALTAALNEHTLSILF